MLSLPPETPLWVILLVAVVSLVCLAGVRVLRASIPQDSPDRVTWWADRRRCRAQAKTARWRRRRQDREDRRAYRLQRRALRDKGAEQQAEPQHDA